ncbi:MAG: hypothetical protein Q9163_003062, partial [Psora crenata]
GSTLDGAVIHTKKMGYAQNVIIRRTSNLLLLVRLSSTRTETPGLKAPSESSDGLETASTLWSRFLLAIGSHPALFALGHDEKLKACRDALAGDSGTLHSTTEEGSPRPRISLGRPAGR